MSKSEEDFVRALREGGHHADEAKLRRLYESIPDKNLIDQVIATYGKPSPHPVAHPNVASYANSASATLEVEAFFGIWVTLHVKGYWQHYGGSGGGLIAGVGFTGGTLYYNDINDLLGPSDFNYNCISVYSNLNLIRNGSVYATYSGGGTPLIGISGGSGDWKQGS